MFSNRVTEMVGCDIPILQAPMGYIARSRLASAVRDEIRAMPELATGKPFAVNVAQTVRRAVSGPTSTTSGGVGR